MGRGRLTVNRPPARCARRRPGVGGRGGGGGGGGSGVAAGEVRGNAGAVGRGPGGGAGGRGRCQMKYVLP